jgi:hypothetical protein
MRHHYVPQGYLRGFSCPLRGRQFIWVYDKRPGRAPTCKSVKSIAWALAYYAQERQDGSLDTDSVERNIAVNVDTKAAELISVLNPLSNQMDFSEDQRDLLAFFIGLSLTRVPSFRDGLRDLYSQIAQYTAEVLGPQLWTGPGPAPALKAVAKEWVTLDHMIEGAQQIADSVANKNWQFFRSPNSTPFITSDNPVVFNGTAPGHPDSEVIMTLTKRLAIVCTPREFGARYPVFDASRQLAKSMNSTIARAARHRIFASECSDGLENLAKKHAKFEQKIAT